MRRGGEERCGKEKWDAEGRLGGVWRGRLHECQMGKSTAVHKNVQILVSEIAKNPLNNLSGKIQTRK